jgi:hypothetical protein
MPLLRWRRRAASDDLWAGPVIVAPVMYEFEAVIARVGVPDRSNRMLQIPKDINDKRMWAREGPLPVLPMGDRHLRVGRSAPEGPIGKVENLEIVGSSLVAWGSLYESEVSRDYAGALSLKTAWMVVNVQAAREEGGVDRPDGLRLHGWKVLGVSVVDRMQWDVRPVKLWRVNE